METTIANTNTSNVNKLQHKSIFDLDDDYLEDSKITTNLIPNITNSTAEKDMHIKSNRENTVNLNNENELSVENPDQMQWVVEEDILCKAKLYYESLKNKITDEFINNVHNSYLSNINGNWELLTGIKHESQTDDEYNNFVKKYDHIHNDKIVKDFSKISLFYSKYSNLFYNENEFKKKLHNSIESNKSETKHSFENIDNRLSFTKMNCYDPNPIKNDLCNETSTARKKQNEIDSEKSNLVFKEWHEIVQLKSNEDTLTVLPYVIID